MEKYFPGAILPPHLSPFVEEKEGEYVPPEQRVLRGEELPDSGNLLGTLPPNKNRIPGNIFFF